MWVFDRRAFGLRRRPKRQKCTKSAHVAPGIYVAIMPRGRVHKRHGGYAFRVDIGADPATGRRRQVHRQGFRTKREAETALAELLAESAAGTSVSPSRIELADFLDDWLDGQRNRLKETTWESYRVEPLRFDDAGDQVAVVVRIVGRTHELEVDETRSSLLTVRDGRVVRVQSFADPVGAREAAGLPTQPPPPPRA